MEAEKEIAAAKKSLRRLNSVAEVLAGMADRFHPAACADLRASYHWSLSGAQPREFTIVIDRGTFRIEEGENPQADVAMSASTETYLRLVNGEMLGIVAIMTRKLRVRGSLQMVAKMERIFI